MPLGSHTFQPYHAPHPPPPLGYHSVPAPSQYHRALPYAPSPPPVPYHGPFTPAPASPYHAPYSSAPTTAYPSYSHPKSSPYNSLFTNDIREKSRTDKDDIYLKTEAELADRDFSGPFFYHYKSKSKHGNLGKEKKG